MKKFLHSTLLLLTVCFLPLHGQEPPTPRAPVRISPPRTELPQEIQAPPDAEVQPGIEEMTGNPYWRETVDNAVEEFESDNPEVRRSAVMLLGKYPVAPAREVVARGLKDEDASVRQAALVSVLEEQGQLHPSLTAGILQMLADPNVGIRRIASSSLRTLILSYSFVMQPGTARAERQLPANASRILQEAFQDEDASVRRNMVSHYSFLNIDLPEETIVALLNDSDPEVAVHTLSWGLRLLSPATLAQEIEELARREERRFRLELARGLQSRRTPETMAALKFLQKDEDAAVALEAMLAAFQHEPSVDLYKHIVEVYQESGERGNTGQRIIFGAQLLGDAGEPFLREWLQDSKPEHRQQAAQLFLNNFGREAEMNFLISLLEDSARGVRQHAMRALMQSNERLNADHVRQTISNRHVDVRRGAAGLTSFLPKDEAEDLLLDLLLDDVRDVRIAALHQIGQRRIDGWEEIMAISLQVDDTTTQRTALEWLVRHPSPETLRALRAYLEKNPQSPLRPHIETHLKRHERSEQS